MRNIMSKPPINVLKQHRTWVDKKNCSKLGRSKKSEYITDCKRAQCRKYEKIEDVEIRNTERIF